MTGMAGTSAWTTPPGEDGWSATNQDGFCSLKRAAKSADTRFEFVFLSRLREDDESREITFQVIATPARLVWPVRVSLGSKPNAPQIEIGADSSSSTSLIGTGALQLLEHLKTGGALHVVYSLSDGMEGRIFLDHYRFSQSAAMFEACTAHVA